jgi:hypothetical protein
MKAGPRTSGLVHIPQLHLTMEDDEVCMVPCVFA